MKKISILSGFVSIAMSALLSTSSPLVAANQGITPDMCLDGVCVEQDIGELALTLTWQAVDADTQRRGEYQRKNDQSVRKGIARCAEFNRKLWNSKAERLCELLMLGNDQPRNQLIEFFKANTQAVCVTGGKTFNFVLTTPLGYTRIYAGFSRDGRPKISSITKDFLLTSPTSKSELNALMGKKHFPIKFTESGEIKAPWGGYVKYSEYRNDNYYSLSASKIFENTREGPNEGACTPEPQTISVQ